MLAGATTATTTTNDDEDANNEEERNFLVLVDICGENKRVFLLLIMNGECVDSSVVHVVYNVFVVSERGW